MAKYCPYCGKQLSERSRFCPHCGKAKPERSGTGPVLAERPASVGAYPERGTQASRYAAATIAGSRTGQPRAANLDARTGKAAYGYAPPTHSLIGAFEQAGFGLRYGAWMFDFLITLMAMMGFTFIVTAASHHSVIGSNTDLVWVAGLSVLLFVLNFVLVAGRNGQSAGMRIVGIRIARVDGRSFGFKDAALRHLVGYPLSSIVFFLGFLWMLWDPSQQAWHDKLSRTIVVMSR